jgi:sugar/nucleoside kinase (ribokinase family)
MGAILYQTLYHNDMSARDMVRYANAVGALCAMKKGGIPAMPSKIEIDSILYK